MYRNWRRLIKPRAMELVEINEEKTYSKFVAKPLEQGFGTTLGNTMRRILLSSLQGAAVTSVMIEDVPHEFSTIPGVTEDITDIILNVKQLRIKLLEGDEATIKIDADGAGEIKARDIQIPGNVQIINPDLHIATLNKDGKLKANLLVRSGKGYVTAEDNKREDDPVGLIPVDSVFSPVVRCNYSVTNARVGQRTDYDKLTMELWTNGSVEPIDAVGVAAKILKEHLQVFINFDETVEPAEEAAAEEEKRYDINPNLYRRVDELELSVRSANCLQNANIKHIGELCQRSEAEMLKTKNFGRKSLNEIKSILTNMNLNLGMNLDGFNATEAEKYRPKDVE